VLGTGVAEEGQGVVLRTRTATYSTMHSEPTSPPAADASARLSVRNAAPSRHEPVPMRTRLVCFDAAAVLPVVVVGTAAVWLGTLLSARRQRVESTGVKATTKNGLMD
jgi:hypothetical protein